MTRYSPMRGKRFGDYTALYVLLGLHPKKSAMWACLCVCGIVRFVESGGLTSGNSRGCGCRRYEKVALANSIHGMYRSRTYTAWQNMRARCLDPKNKRFADYGGRGIKICERWGEFQNFLADLGECPSGLQLDRGDNDRGYEPGNCRWATRSEQQNNRRTNRVVKWRGRSLTATQWARELGIEPNTIICRLRRGWSVDRALGTE